MVVASPFLSQSLAELNPEVDPRTTAFPGMFGVSLASGGGGRGKEALGGHRDCSRRPQVSRSQQQLGRMGRALANRSDKLQDLS